MTTKKINQYLEELYEFDPNLREHDAALRQLIPQMIATKPESGFSPDLVQQIKTHLEQNIKKTNHKFMVQKKMSIWRPSLLWSTGVVAMLFLAITVFQIIPENKVWLANKDPEIGIKKVTASAFGPLNSQGTEITDSRMLNSASTNQSATEKGELTVTASSASSKLIAPISMMLLEDDDLSPIIDIVEFSHEEGLSSVDVSGAARMIMPITNYLFTYQGEALNLSEINNTVYKRLKNQSGPTITNLFTGLKLGAIDLNFFTNLKTTYLSLAEDKPFGLVASFDFNEDSASLYSNWEKWRNPERDSCQDQACWDRFRVKYEDIPEDSVVIAATNQFLTNLGINPKNYGEPGVNNYWRQWYDQSEDKANYYLPDTVSVVYPLLIEGQEVNNSAGEPDGVWVSYNILEKRVSDAGAFTPYNYEASEYTVETNSDHLIALAEAGGWNHSGYYFYEKLDELEVINKTLALDTPHQGLIRFWSYQNNISQELFAPALIFPILNAPTDYYGPKNIIVPLIQDLINELTERNDHFGPSREVMSIAI